MVISASYFTSDRERRLWFWALTALALIYSTLPVSRTLAGALRNSGLLQALFILGMLLVGVTVATHGLKTRPGGVEIGVVLGVAAVYLMVFLRMAIPEERTHLIEYGVVAVFVHEALTERASQGRRVPLPPLLAVLATSLVGALDECIQSVVPSRVFDPSDILFNALAGAMAVATSVALAWARGRSLRASTRWTGDDHARGPKDCREDSQ